jgi:signal transduction histidine kinase
VEDTGIGIHEDEISKLFQDFQQLPNSRKAGQGTGLGLALTRRIVEAQGGTIEVRSKPGEGSVFSATLPLQPASHPAALARVS